jgi:phosphomannomutase
MTCRSDRIAGALRTVRQAFADYPLDTRDGVKVIMPDGWLLVRGSNTEPIIRVVAEAKSEERARSLVDGVIGKISR